MESGILAVADKNGKMPLDVSPSLPKCFSS
jgi:hypothetical protein